MNNTKIKFLNILLIIGIFGGTLLTAIFNYLPSHLATYWASILVVLVPIILKLTIFKLDDVDCLVYYIFVFFSYFIGSVINLYNTTEYYDVIMHFLSGFVISYFAIVVLKRLNMYKAGNRLFNFIFCVFFAAGAACVWEIAEFSIDQLTASNLQHNLDTGVIDTMGDMICGTVGGIIFSTYMILKNKK